MKYTSIITLLLLSLFSIETQGQELLSKDEAVNVLLSNNYDVRVAKNNVEVAKNNTSVFNNNHLPTVTANAGANYSNNNITANRQDGTTTTLRGATTERYNASVDLNYTLFDGFRRKYLTERAEESLDQSELQQRATIENAILQLFQQYYEVARLTENVATLRQTLDISKNRLLRAKYQFEYGQNSRLDVSNAEVDVNTDSINVLNTLQLLQNSKRNLNTLLGRDVNIGFQVDTTVQFSDVITREDLFNGLENNNILLLQSDNAIALSRYDLKVNNSAYLPNIGVTGSYGWGRNNNNEASFLASQSFNGINAGVSLQWSIFDGGTTKTSQQNALIAVDNQRLLREQAKQALARDFDNAWGDYQNRLFILTAQEKNLSTNQINFNRTEEQYKLGRVTSIEFRQAQINLLNAQTSRNQAKYDAKLAELTLLQLSGLILDADF
ncbi:MAG: TolC family protein [Bacteroidota bacterium]